MPRISRLAALVFFAALIACGCASSTNGGAAESQAAGQNTVQSDDVAYYARTKSVQCAPSQATQANLTAEVARLSAAGVAVVSSACGLATGIVTPAVCGGPTAEIWLVVVSPASSGGMQALGYQPVAARLGAKQVACAASGA